MQWRFRRLIAMFFCCHRLIGCQDIVNPCLGFLGKWRRQELSWIFSLIIFNFIFWDFKYWHPIYNDIFECLSSKKFTVWIVTGTIHIWERQFAKIRFLCVMGILTVVSKALLDNWGVLMKNIRPNSDMREEERIMKNLWEVATSQYWWIL